jgi:hypothetical protein
MITEATIGSKTFIAEGEPEAVTQQFKEFTKAIAFPELPDLNADRAFSHMHNVPGPDEIAKLAVAASEQVREYLAQHLNNKALLDRLRFETLIMPFMFEARRIGDARGQAREKSMFSGLFPGTE